ncbi:elongation factor Ts [Candidatus Marinamargulisbacteria bacterium SCGC AG-439-L15]|nr:elongation factor Ts [Candidatus Marinamargulisbacteria bacterium SCGC AG-439-L15]
MGITSALVKELREKTGVGMMNCKKALVENGGDLEKAVQYLREKGLAVASKKADRAASEGRIFTVVDGGNGVLLELNCETDFVASNDEFDALGRKIAKFALSENLKTSEAIQASSVDGKPFNEFLSEAILKLGENLQLGRVESVSTDGSVSSYEHSNGKIGVLVGFSSAISEDLGRDIAMHVAASQPQYIQESDVDQSFLDQERQVLKTQVENEGKPAEIADKIVEGKLKKQLKEICLLDQAFVKNPDQSIAQLLPDGTAIAHFSRFSLV